MRDDVLAMADQLRLTAATVVGHSMGGVVGYHLALDRPDLVRRLVVEDAPPPYERDHPVPLRDDDEPLGFDWGVVPAIVGEVNAGDPSTWARLRDIAAPTLIVGGGESSHIPQAKLRDVARLMPNATMVTIPVGHHVHETEPRAFLSAAEVVCRTESYSPLCGRQVALR